MSLKKIISFLSFYMLSLLGLAMFYPKAWSSLQAQTYYEIIPSHVTLNGYIRNDFVSLKSSTASQGTHVFTPRAPWKIGLKLSTRYLPMSLAYSQSIALDSKASNFKIMGEWESFTWDIGFQNFKSFRLTTKTDYGSTSTTVNTKFRHFRLGGYYMVSPEKFSYKAAFTSEAKQLKDGASLLVGCHYNFINYEGDSTRYFFASNSHDYYHLLECTAGIGYSDATFFPIPMSILWTIGFNIIDPYTPFFISKDTHIGFCTDLMLSAKSDFPTWGLIYLAGFNYQTLWYSKAQNSYLISGQLELTYYHRFSLPTQTRRYLDRTLKYDKYN